jgi:uncharacterized protein (TIGR03085 family)
MTPHQSFASRERALLADSLEAAGPDAPTMCAGWDAFDLVAHMVARERRPDSSPGIMVPALAGWTERVRTGMKKQHTFAELVGLFRNGPPTLSLFSLPGVDSAFNRSEFFIHHEDVRRARPGWEPRVLHPKAEEGLWKQLTASAKLAMRKAPAGVTLSVPGGPSFVAREGDPMVTVSGPPSELTLYCSGRQSVALVETSGDSDAIKNLAAASFGF